MSTPQHPGQDPQAGQPYNQAAPQGLPPGYEIRQKKPWYKKAGCIIPLILVLLLLAILGGCTALLGGAANEVDKQMNAEYTVTYRITGDAQDALATYWLDETEQSQESGLQAGWEREATIKGFRGAHLLATNGIHDEGTVTCQIEVNGTVITENTASGAGTSATCSADSSAISDASK